MLKKSWLSVFALVLAGHLVACGDDENEGPGEGSGLSECRVEIEGELYLGALLPFSGPLAIGDDLINAVRQAVSGINEAGGVQGRTLGVLSCDSACDGASATAGLNELLGATPRISGVVGALCSGATLPMVQDVASAAGVPVVSPGSSSPAFTTSDPAGVFFRTFPSDALQGRIVSEIAQRETLNNVFVINRDDAYGNGLRDVFISEFEASGGTADSFTYDETQSGFATAAVDAAEAANPDGVFLIGFQTDGAAVFREAVEQGFTPTQWLGPDGLRNAGFITAVANDSALDGMIGTIAAAPTGTSYDAFAAQYQSLFGESPESFTANSYDAVYVLAIAMELAEDPTSFNDVRANLANVSSGPVVRPEGWSSVLAEIDAGFTAVDYAGASGPVDFDAAGDVQAFTEEWEIVGGEFQSTACWTPSVQRVDPSCGL